MLEARIDAVVRSARLSSLREEDDEDDLRLFGADGLLAVFVGVAFGDVAFTVVPMIVALALTAVGVVVRTVGVAEGDGAGLKVRWGTGFDLFMMKKAAIATANAMAPTAIRKISILLP